MNDGPVENTSDDCAIDPVQALIGEAILVGTAFRLRDSEALILTLRRLVDAIERLAADGSDPSPSCEGR